MQQGRRPEGHICISISMQNAEVGEAISCSHRSELPSTLGPTGTLVGRDPEQTTGANMLVNELSRQPAQQQRCARSAIFRFLL